MKDTFLQIAGVTSEKEFYKKYPTEEAFFQAHPEAMQMRNGGEMIRRADGSYSQRGLWDNIRANKGSGKKPTKEMLEQERKIRAEEKAYGGAVDLNAFYNQPRFVQTNIFAEGGDFLTEFQFAGEFMNKNPWYTDPNAPKQPPVILTPEQKTVFMNNQNSWGTPPAPTEKPIPTTGVPAINPNLPMNKPAATATPAAKQIGPSSLGPGQYKMQEVAKHQMIGNKLYKDLSDVATMPLYNPAIGMMPDSGLAGYLKMGIGALAGVSGMATGLDNVVRGFKARKPENLPANPTGPVGNNLKWDDPKNAAALNQETVQQEMMRKASSPVNPPAKTTFPIPGMEATDEFNRTAAYGGMIEAANGMTVPAQTPQPTDFTQNGNPIYVGQNRLEVDLQGGLNRAMGANAGISMFNNALGFKQGMKDVRQNTVKAGMTDFAFQPDDTNWMPMGYDTLNTGPGQTQAPNLYTPVQYTGVQMQSQFQEGGEYDLSEEEIQAILAAGGEIEFL